MKTFYDAINNDITMTTKTVAKQSQLISSLREGIAVIQMILFKEVKESLLKKQPLKESTFLSMLAGSITNEIFASHNMEEKFVLFRKKNRAEIEQELLSLRIDNPGLCAKVTDALRIQTLCDNEEKKDSSDILVRAKELGILVEEREVPLPSTFMAGVRLLGEEHNLIIPPVQITPEQDEIIH